MLSDHLPPRRQECSDGATFRKSLAGLLRIYGYRHTKSMRSKTLLPMDNRCASIHRLAFHNPAFTHCHVAAAFPCDLPFPRGCGGTSGDEGMLHQCPHFQGTGHEKQHCRTAHAVEQALVQHPQFILHNADMKDYRPIKTPLEAPSQTNRLICP